MIYITIYKMPKEDCFHNPGRSSQSFLTILLYRPYQENNTIIEHFLKNRDAKSAFYGDFSWEIGDIHVDLLEHS